MCQKKMDDFVDFITIDGILYGVLDGHEDVWFLDDYDL